MEFDPNEINLDTMALLKARKRDDDGTVTALDPPREDRLAVIVVSAVEELMESEENWESIRIFCRGEFEQFPIIHTEEQIRALYKRVKDEQAAASDEQSSQDATDATDDGESADPAEPSPTIH